MSPLRAAVLRTARLCYIERGMRAYFTTCPLDLQTGDDWDDTPYEMNAGPPYAWGEWRNVEPYEIVTLQFEGYLTTPEEGFPRDDWQRYRTTWSVDDINRGLAPWLQNEAGGSLFAGATVAEFAAWVEFSGGQVYWPLSLADYTGYLLQEAL